MATCFAGFDGSINSNYMEKLFAVANKYLMSTSSLSEVDLNQGGQTSKELINIVNNLNSKFGAQIGKVRFRDNGLKYISIEVPQEFVNEKKRLAEDLEQSIQQNKVDAERAGIDYTDDYLFKLKSVNNEATIQQIVKAKEWFDKSPLSKVIPFKEAFHVINSNAVAQWNRYGITLFHGANYSDIYHEAWHGFSQLYLTKEQKASLYNEARKVLGSELTDLQVEEVLAEDFRKYILSGSKKVLDQRPERNTIFRKIYNFLKKLFGGVTATEAIEKQMALSTVQEMYNNLHVGNFLDLKPSVDNIQFTSLNKGLTSLSDASASLNYEQSRGIVEAIDYFIAEIIDKNNIPVTSLYSSERGLQYVYEAALEGLKKTRDAIAEIAEGVTSEVQKLALQEKVDALNFAISNYGDVSQASKRNANGTIAYHKKVSKYLDFTVTAKSLEEILDIDTADVADYTQIFDRSGTEGTMIDSADPSVMYMLRSIPTNETNYFGLPKLYSATEVFKRLARTVSGKHLTMGQMYDALNNSKDPILRKVASKLGEPSSFNPTGERFNLWAKFYQTYNKYEIPIVEFVHEIKDGKSRNGFGRATGSAKKIKNDWKRIFATGKNGLGEVNPYAVRTKTGYVLNVEKLREDFPKVTPDNVFSYLNAIGIYVEQTPEVAAEVKKLTSRISAYIRPAIEAIYDKDSKSPDFDGINDVVKLMSNGRPDIFINGNPIESNATLVNNLVELHRIHSEKAIFGTVLNAANKPQNEFSLNNSLTEIVASLNDPNKTYQEIVSQPHMASWDIRKNPYAKRSILLNSMFDLDLASPTFGQRLNNAKLTLENYNGLKIIKEEGSEGISTTNLDPYSKFTMDMYSMLSSGSMELMRHASKSTAYSIKLSGKILTGENATNQYLYVDINKFGANDQRGSRATIDILKNYLAAELERALIVRNKNVNISGFTDQAKNLTLFGDMLNDQSLVDQLLSFNLEQDILDQIRSNEDINTKVEVALAKYLAEQTKNNLEIFSKLGYTNNTLRNLAGVSSDTAVRAFTANALIHNFEMLSLFYGDPAVYNHKKEDFHKRNAGIASTGDTHVTDQSAIDHINNLKFGYSEKLAAEEGFKVDPFTTVLNTAVIEDVIVDMEQTQPELFNEYLAAFKEAGISEKFLDDYKKTNAADGQGYISFDFYRASRVLLGKWNPKQEALYNKIVTGQEVKPSEISKTFPPLKYQYFGPIVTNELNVYAFHKFSLFPLVPTVVKGTNLEKLHNQMVRQNVHYVTFKSGSKLADGAAPTKVFGENVEYANQELAPYKVHLQFLKDQVNISDEFKEEVRFSTQLRKLVLQYLYDNGKPVSEKAQQLVEQYENDTVKHVEKKLADLYSSLGLSQDGKSLEDKEKLAQYLKERLSKRDVPEHVIDYIDTTLNKKLSHNLDFSLNSNEIEKALYSIVANDVIKTKVNGEPLVQVSGVGFEKSGFETDSKLKFYRSVDGQTQPMEVKIALQGNFKKLLKLNHSDGSVIGTIERLNEMLKKPSFKALYKEYLQMIAVRIPVQGHNSMEFMEVAEFLPVESGPSIVLPHEITTKSGGDFDIDKLTVMMPNFNVKDNGIEFTTDDNTIEGLENLIIQDVIEILQLKENFVNLIRPNSTDIVKPIADEAESLNVKFKWSSGPAKILEAGYNLYKHEVNNVGKISLGIGAVDNTNNTLFNRLGFAFEPTMLANPYMDPSKFNPIVPATILLPHNKTEEEGINLSGLKTVDGESIGDIIAQLMNGWVDVEKDAWIFNVQGNDIVAPILLFMIEAGVPYVQAVKFVSNPLVKEYVEKVKLYRSPFSKEYTGKMFDAENMAIASVLQKFVIHKKLGGTNPAGLNQVLYKSRHNNFTEGELNSLFLGKPSDKVQETAFLHFLQLRQLAGFSRQIKQSANFDTASFSTRSLLLGKTSKIDKVLRRTKEQFPVSEKTANDYVNNNKIVSAFAKASQSQLDAWNFFTIRNNQVIQDAIFEYSDKSNREAQEKTSNNILSQIFTAIYQDALLGADYSMKEYKGLPVKKATVPGGVIVKDGVVYIDLEEIKMQLQQNSINLVNQNFNRASVNASTFNFKGVSQGQNLDQYFNFLVEREVLRYTEPRLEEQDVQKYEEKLRDKALYNTNNLWYMFSSHPEARSYASIFSTLMDRYPDLSNRYSVLQDLVLSRIDGTERLKLSTRITDVETVNAYHENLKELSDPSVVKVDDPKANLDISNFFSRFGTFAFLQNGFTQSEYNLSKIAPSESYTEIMENHVSSISDINTYLGELIDNIIKRGTEEEYYEYSIPYRTGLVSYLPTLAQFKQQEKAEISEKLNKTLSELGIELKQYTKDVDNTKDKENFYLYVGRKTEAGYKRAGNIGFVVHPSESTVEEFKASLLDAFNKISYLSSEGTGKMIFDSNFYSDQFGGFPEHKKAFSQAFKEFFGSELPGFPSTEEVQVTEQDVLDAIKRCK